ncbi:MAG: cation diffusion facilitator family transporter [Bacilli bacterium]|nr:cation diffusion facilitator family transporter [Bacilli bacterium]
MKENRIIIITMLLNLLIACIKLTFGILFQFSTLLADAIQSFMDFITDVTSIITNKIGKRRANHNYPFGYGQAYSLSNIFTGFLLFLIGLFILLELFIFESHYVPNIKVFIILFLILGLKSVVVYFLVHFGKKFKNQFMLEAANESRADLVSTIVVILVSIIMLFNKNIPDFIDVDKIGSIGMIIYIFYVSIKMMVANISSLLTHTENNEDIKIQISEIIKTHKNVELKEIELIKMYTYYHAIIKVHVSDSLTIKKFLILENKLKKEIRNKVKEIKFIDIEPVV